MRRNLQTYLAVGITALLIGGVALANYFNAPVIMKGGLTLGGLGTRIDDSYAASSAIDFAGVTDQCEDSGAITVTGAAVNDVCVVGPPATMPGTHSWLTCYVSAADAVKVRHCSHGASGNPASATYTVRVFDP